MSGKWPSGAKEEELIRRREDDGLTIVEIAKIAGVSQSTASYHLNGIIPLTRMINTLPHYPEELVTIKGDCALTSDWHAPYFSMIWLKRLIAVCQKLDVYQLAIVGDLTDMKWISSYVGRDQRGGLAKDFQITVSLLQLLLHIFDRVYWCRGNHEDRLLAALGEHDILPVFAELTAKGASGELITTPSATMLLDETWRLEHPKAYSRDAAKIASQVSSIFHKNVACAHGHFMGYKHDISGKYIGLDLGGMFDMEKQEYLYLGGVTTHPRWNPGFWIYRNGKPDPFDNAFINWDEWEVDNGEV